jgi:hypothetical protein
VPSVIAASACVNEKYGSIGGLPFSITRTIRTRRRLLVDSQKPALDSGARHDLSYTSSPFCFGRE